MTLDEFNKLYRYKSDASVHGRIEHWTIIEPDDGGLYKGDCEDYCMTLKDKVNGFENGDYYFCKLDGVGHCVLVLDDKIIDCNVKKLITYDSYNSLFNVTDFKRINLFTYFVKITQSRINNFMRWILE